MHYIDISQDKIENAKQLHYKYLRYVIKKKLNGKYFKESKPHPSVKTVQFVYGIKSEVKNFLNVEKNLKKVLIGNPEVLDSIKDKFKTKKQVSSLRKLFNYDTFVDYNKKSTYFFYNAYNLAENLDIPTCPYCNRMYTKTVTNPGKITRPTFDHWFPNSKYPLLSLSFFNLVPSCNVCNGGKSATLFNLGSHFHPYYKSDNPNDVLSYKFSYNNKDYSNFTFKIITDNEFSKISTGAFKLSEIYKAHEDEIKDLKRIRDAYSESYLSSLETILSAKNISREELYRLAFGTHLEDTKHDRRPLSKMKKDILIELGIIKN